MNLKKYILSILILSIIASCDNCNKKKKIAEWATQVDGSSIPVKSVINVQLKFLDGEESIDSLVYLLNNKRIFSTTMLTQTFTLNSDSMKMGMYTITATIYRGKKKEVHSANFTLISDVVPLKSDKQIGAVFPHSNANFTEGFFISNGMVYESTGLNGSSFICRYRLGSKTPEKLTTMPEAYFGEGSILVDNRLIQLTWKNGVGVVYDAKKLKQVNEFRIGGEGWGLTYNGENLIMSDGTHRLFFLDKETYAVVKILEVYDNKGAVTNLNELEYIDGVIYSNIWQTDNIVKIDATTGKVLAYINCEGLLTEAEIAENNCDVLNGIAYDAQSKKIYITGKKWPKIFELKN